MDETKKLYEAMVIISCKCGGEGITAIVEKLKKLIEEHAELKSSKEWGKKKLAYPINKETEAYYVLFEFVSESAFPEEFMRICRITDGVFRAMVVKHVVKKKKKPVKKLPKKVETAVTAPDSAQENEDSEIPEPSSSKMPDSKSKEKISDQEMV